jgi:hypothetical protein
MGSKKRRQKLKKKRQYINVETEKEIKEIMRLTWFEWFKSFIY